jgi:carbon-monoxide dehydrogenase medium subunit
MAPVLYLFDAEVETAGADGTIRRLPVNNLHAGSSKTILQYNEAIIRFIIPKPRNGTVSAFCKLGFRKAVTVSRIGLAIMLETDHGGVIVSSKTVAGAIAPAPVRVEKADQYLTGKKNDAGTANEVGKLLSELVMEITPGEFDRDYKARAAYGIAEDIFLKLRESV